MSFSDLGLLPELLRAVADKGYDTPSPIQLQAIPAVLGGRDVLAAAVLHDTVEDAGVKPDWTMAACHRAKGGSGWGPIWYGALA